MGGIAQHAHFLATTTQKKTKTFYDSRLRPTAWARVISASTPSRSVRKCSGTNKNPWIYDSLSNYSIEALKWQKYRTQSLLCISLKQASFGAGFLGRVFVYKLKSFATSRLFTSIGSVLFYLLIL